MRAAGSGAAHAGAWEPLPGEEGRAAGRGGAGPFAVRPLISAAAAAGGARAPPLTSRSGGEEDPGGVRVSQGRIREAGSGQRRWRRSRFRRREQGPGWRGGLRVEVRGEAGLQWKTGPGRGKGERRVRTCGENGPGWEE